MSRRRFLGGLAGLPALLPSLSALAQGDTGGPRVAVIGAGAFGGWTALHLLRAGARVELLDAWGPGNPRASSGGESRVIRAIYGPDRIYVELVQRSFALWEDLQTATDETLYRETGALWMISGGDDGYVRSAVPILRELGFEVQPLKVERAARRYPQIDFAGVSGTYLEPRAGALYARDACRLVRRVFEAAGGRYRTARVKPPEPAAGRLRQVVLDDGSRVPADAFVFACGPWLGRMFPDVVGSAISPSRQEVYYFGTPPGSSAFGPGRLPVWIDLGSRLIYGLPDVHGRGFKLADDTRGPDFDPTSGERAPSAAGIASAREFLARRFPALRDAPLLESRVCQYENSPDGDLILDRHPAAANVWLAGGGSGHGFKLSPALGEHAAACVLGEAEPHGRFLLERLKEGGRAKP